MKIRSLALATAALAFALPSQAADSYMTVYAWDPGCQHTVETNNFDLAAGAAVEIQVDLTQCTPAQLAGLLFHGYAPRNSGSDALTRRHNVRLRVVSDAGLDAFSDDGYVFTQIPAPTRVTLLAENLNLRKSLAIRLVSKSGL